MSKSLEEIVYDICLDEFSSAEDRIKNIKRAVENWTFEQEKEKRITKGLKAQMQGFTSLMKEINTAFNKNVRPSPPFLPQVYVSADSNTAYFGTAFMLFALDVDCQFLKELEEKPPIRYESLYCADSEKYGIFSSFFTRMTPWERKFEVEITFPELIVAKRLNIDDCKTHFPFFKEVVNVDDAQDKIGRWFNAYTLLQAFKIFGVDKLTLLCTDDYKDAAISAGYNEYVGNFKFITTFSMYNGGAKKYEEETEARRVRIEASRKEHKELVKGVVAKGKARKIKFTRLQNPDMPSDEDLPF